MAEAIVGAIIGAVIAGLLGAAAVYWGFVLRRERKELGYEVLSANVLIPGPPEATPDIGIIVRNRLIDKEHATPEAFSPVERVLGFRVRIKNSGNMPLQSQVVTLELGSGAITLSGSVEKQPDLGAEVIAVEPQFQEPRRTRFTVPFLNPGHEIVVSLQSIGNSSDMTCAVSAGAPGLHTYDLARRRRRRDMIQSVLVLVVIVSVIGGLIIVLALTGDDDSTSGFETPAAEETPIQTLPAEQSS
jgi:hypothetical protein